MDDFRFVAFIYNTFIACVYISNTYCLGHIMSMPFTRGVTNDFMKLTFRWAVGWNMIIFIVHILGLISCLNIVTYLILSFSGLSLYPIIYRKYLINYLPTLKEDYLSCREKIISLVKKNKVVTGVLLSFVTMMYLISLAPVSKTDELNYYYYFIKRIVGQGALLFDYDQVLSFQPLVQQLWYVPVYGLGATEAPAVLNVFTSLLIIFVTYLWLSKYTEGKFALLAIIATYISQNSVSIIPAPQDNVAAWLWCLITLIATYEFLYSKQYHEYQKFMFLSLGLIYVTACVVKMTNLPLVFLCFLALFYKTYISKINYKQLILIFVPFLVIYTPFLIRIYLWTGSPLFPAFSNLLGSKTFDVEAMNIYLQRPSYHYPDNFVGVVKYLILDVFPHNIQYNQSLLLFMLSPIAIICLIYNKKYLIGTITFIYWISFFFITASPRLMGGLTIFLLLTLFIHNKDLMKNRFMVTIIKVHAIFIVLITAIYFVQFGKYIFGNETKEEFLDTKVQAYQGINWANHNLPANSKILTDLHEKYYFNYPVYCLDECPLVMGEDVRKIRDPKGAYLFIRKHGITHLFLTDLKFDFYKDFIELLYQVGRTYGELIYEEEKATVKGVRYPLLKPRFGKLEIYEIF
jgi:hypothetical protein